jgi:hypothetical protein
MIYQIFKRISTDETINAVFSKTDGSFSDSLTDSRRSDLAAALNIDPSDISASIQSQKPSQAIQTLILPIVPQAKTRRDRYNEATTDANRLRILSEELE